MRVHQRIRRGQSWTAQGDVHGGLAQLALVFSSPELLREQSTWDQLRAMYPETRLVACSTAGEIADTEVLDDSIVCTGIAFEHSRVAVSAVLLREADSDVERGELLVARLPQEGLVHLLVLSDGLKVNGSALVAGIVARLPRGVAVTGGLSGDGARFQRTAVCLDGPEPSEQIAAIGLYGSRLRVGMGSMGGWDPFGPERRITRSVGNVLHELDGEPALDLYKRYLGDHSASLPASGLLFPLAIRGDGAEDRPVVRTILAVDEAARTLTFAGDVPVGHRAQLMRASVERLVDGATGAARISRGETLSDSPDLALLISCVGRKLVLKQRVEEEVEAVREILGSRTTLTGFYSYGEISPFTPAARCELHNQTMTITTLSER